MSGQIERLYGREYLVCIAEEVTLLTPFRCDYYSTECASWKPLCQFFLSSEAGAKHLQDPRHSKRSQGVFCDNEKPRKIGTRGVSEGPN